MFRRKISGVLPTASRSFDGILALQALSSYAFFLAFLVAPLLYVLLITARLDPQAVLGSPRLVALHRPQEPVLVADFGGSALVIFRGFNYGILVNSFIVSSIATLASVLLGLVMAYVVARYSFPLKGLLRLLILVPMLPAPFINAFVVNKFFDPVNGVLPWLMRDVLGLPFAVGFQDMAGVILYQVMAFYPIAFLNIQASMASIDTTLEEQAENLGSKGLTKARTVILPLSTPGIASAAATIFIFSLEDLGGPIAFRFRDLMSYEIYFSFQQAALGGLSPFTAFVAVVMLASAIAFLIAVRSLSTRKKYAGQGRTSRTGLVRSAPGPLGLAAIYAFLFPVALFAALPQAGVLVFALAGSSWLRTPLPESLSLSILVESLSEPVVVRALLNSIIYSLSALAIMFLVGFSVAYVSHRLRGPAAVVLDTLATSPLAVPGLVVALGYLYFFTDVLHAAGLSFISTAPAVSAAIVIAYAARKGPFLTRAIYAGLQQVSESFEEAAMNLGASRSGVLRRITIPLLLPSIAAGSIVSFSYSMSEVSVSVTLGGIVGQGVNHAAPITYIMSDYIANKVQSVAAAAALGSVLLGVELLGILLVSAVLRQRHALISVTAP